MAKDKITLTLPPWTNVSMKSSDKELVVEIEYDCDSQAIMTTSGDCQVVTPEGWEWWPMDPNPDSNDYWPTMSSPEEDD